MAVVVDRGFFRALGMTEMRTVADISNSDVIWFVIDFVENDEGRFKLVPFNVYLTTLEDSVQGLTAGTPTSLSIFESRIIEKRTRLLESRSGPIKIASN